MVKEKITYNDGSEVELELGSLGYRRASQIAEEFYSMDKMTQHVNGDESMSGVFKVAAARRAALESFKDLDLDKLRGEDAVRLYAKYCEKDIMAAIGKSPDPN